jgi:predicted HicB family RNase H-like nuclease
MHATMRGTRPRKEPSVPKPNIQTSIRIDPAVYDAAKAAAARAGVSLNAWIEQALKEKAERDHADLPPSA